MKNESTTTVALVTAIPNSPGRSSEASRDDLKHMISHGQVNFALTPVDHAMIIIIPATDSSEVLEPFGQARFLLAPRYASYRLLNVNVGKHSIH